MPKQIYIPRELEKHVIEMIDKTTPQGIILSGLVGCGKTTMVQNVLEKLSNQFSILQFSGDDVVFRQKVSEDSFFLLNAIQSKSSNKKKLIFVDEVQKSELIFDALKVAFDHGKCSFIVSGSNPAYLSTIAKQRLQRRAEQMSMFPINLMELAKYYKWVPSKLNGIEEILYDVSELNNIRIPKLEVTEKVKKAIISFFEFGGIPLVLLAKNNKARLSEIRLIVERGFELFSDDNANSNDTIRVELAKLHSQEFTYQNIFNKTRLRRRENINSVIDDLINHGYLVRKKPTLLKNNKSSYLSVFSYVDPGIISYLLGTTDLENLFGSRVEGYVHTRLSSIIQNSVIKTNLGYFKNHDLDQAGNVKYLPGEIDFIFEFANRIIPIEVKSTFDLNTIDTTFLKNFVRERNLPFGVILYGGAPRIQKENRLLFWPFWLV